MIREHSTKILPAVILVLVFILVEQPAQADWGVSVYGGANSPGNAYYGDRITSEYRRGYQVDDWVERGESSVTDSPVFDDGIRLTSWASHYEDEYDYGLASAIYFFEIPPSARSIRIKISYEGEADRSDLNGGISGRVWLGRSRIGDDYTEYYPSEERYETVDEPLYGDTYVLRANKRLEIIRVSADDHVTDGTMELHVVAEGRQRIDVKYIEIETYSYMPSVRVITRYYKDYTWNPWYDYTYWYFYTGPTYHFGDYYYVRYTYPRYRYNYVQIRKRYNDYLSVYYVGRPHNHYVHWADVVHVPKGTRRTWDRNRLSNWTREHEEARNSYKIVSMKTRRPVEIRKSRDRVRSVLTTKRTQLSPSASRARSEVAGTSSNTSRTIRTTGSGVTEMEKKRREVQRGTTDSRSRTEVIDRTRTPQRSPVQRETRSSTKVRRDYTEPSSTTRSSSSTRVEQKREVKQSPASTSRDSSVIEKKRRESTRQSSEPRVIKRAPKSESKSNSSSSKVEVQKKDEDDDEDKKSNSSSSTSTKKRSSSSRSSTSSTKKTRDSQ